MSEIVKKEMNAIIVHKEGSIQFKNFEELEEVVKQNLKKYEGIVLTSENKTEIRKIMADLNKVKTSLNDERIKVERAYVKPLELLKDQVKTLITTIDGARSELDKQVKEDDARLISETSAELEAYFNEHLTINSITFLKYADMKQKVNPSDSNRLTAKKKEIDEYIEAVLLDLQEINTDPNKDRLFAKYLLEGNLQRARIELNKEIAKEAEIKAQAEAIKEVPAPEPKVEEKPEVDEIFPTFTLKLYNAPRSVLVKIRELLDQEGVKYE